MSIKRIDTDIDLSLFNIDVNKRSSARKFYDDDEFIERKIEIKHAMKLVNQQWKLNGLRPRTIESYNYNFAKFVEITGVKYLQEINTDKIYEYLASFENVKATSLQGRLKQISAVLKKFLDNGWLESAFWKNIKVKVDAPIKEASNEQDLALLVSLLDKSTFTGLRDSIAIVLLYKTGIRIKTLGDLRTQNIDFDNKLLILQGEIMKSHRNLILPLDDETCALIKELMAVNDYVRREHKAKNDYLFISQVGVPISNTKSPTNLIAKNLSTYSKRWGLKNLNPHAIRRLYGHNLLKRGADINLISHAYGHRDLTTTSKYLGIDANIVAKNLREFL